MHRAIKQRGEETIAAVHWPEDIGKESSKNATLQGQNNEQAATSTFFYQKKKEIHFCQPLNGNFSP